MKTQHYLLMLLLISGWYCSGQANKDSIQITKKIEKAHILIIKIGNMKGQLSTLETRLGERQAEAAETERLAKESSSDNKRAASKLEDDLNSRKKARRAGRAGDAAAHDAKQSRKASDRMKDATDDVNDMKSKIKSTEEKLAKLQKELPEGILLQQ
jgi:hypothetical protein